MKKSFKIILLIFVWYFFNSISAEAAGWLSDSYPYRIGLKLTKQTASSSINYSTVPIEIPINFYNFGITDLDSSSVRAAMSDGITEIPSQSEEWTDITGDGKADTCLLIFQIHSSDLNDASETETEYFIYFDLLSSGVKGFPSYSTDIQYLSAVKSDTLQNSYLKINILDTPVVSYILERSQSSPNLTQAGTGNNIWRNEGMYEINENAAWFGLQGDTFWTRSVNTGPVRAVMTGSAIEYGHYVNPPRVKLTRKWKIYKNYPYFIIDDCAEVVNGQIKTVDY
ncbi:MAG TPA: hypothetical protein PKY81_13620, partial [bacterium]|nr:hypothetical protein [bacterium]